MVAINSSVITTGEGYKDSRRVKILFEETFFNQRDESYRVLCLAQPLEGGIHLYLSNLTVSHYFIITIFAAILDEPVTVTLESSEDCARFLWSDSS